MSFIISESIVKRIEKSPFRIATDKDLKRPDRRLRLTEREPDFREEALEICECERCGRITWMAPEMDYCEKCLELA